MRDIDVIKRIEKKLGIPLKQIDLKDIGTEKNLKAFVSDDKGNVVGLKLNHYAISLDDEIAELPHLEKLYLRNAYIERPDFLLRLKSLRWLDLDGTNVSDFSCLKELEGLTSLSLSGTPVTDVSFLKALKGLTWLVLSDTKVIDVSFLKDLKGLTLLSLSGSPVTDVSFLKELENLTSIFLRGVRVIDFSLLKELEGLTSLSLSGTSVTDVSFLKELKGLTWLDLSGTPVTDVSFLKELKGLTCLSLRNTPVTDFSFLKELENLTSIDLSGTKVREIYFLNKKNLDALTSLSLSETWVKDISFLRELKDLTSLDLSDTPVTDVSFLAELKGLTSLNLSNTWVRNFSFLKELIGLSSVDLSKTPIADVSFLKNLKGLTSLNLSGTHVKNVSFLKGLKDLTWLDLSETNITDISLIESLASLVTLNITKTEFLEEPPKHIKDQGFETILNYFRQKREQGTGVLYEAKVLIVGEPGAGKTSMRKKLTNPEYVIPNKEGEVATLGVEVEKDWHFPFTKDKKIKFHASLWDFGGQDIQYMIHQYFLTGKSLYLLVADERKQNTHFEYWFNIIRLLGEGSPVLVVVNKREGCAITSYDHNEICKSFPGMKIERFELDMAKERQAFDALREKIQSFLCNLDHIGDKLPAKWPLIRDDIERLKDRNHISFDEYFNLCTRHGIKDKNDAEYLSEYLHVLGSIVHFKDDDLLRHLVITNPNWVVDALYTALSDEKIKQDCGMFTRSWLFDLWKNPVLPGKNAYSDEECRQLLALMKKEKFELCYELEESGKFISPQLLPQSSPTYNIDFEGALEYRLRYAFMPEGIMSRLIVRLNHLIRTEHGHQLVWRFGAVFEKDNCAAEVIQTRYSTEGHKEIKVRVAGHDYRKRDLLAIIYNEIEAIHRKSFKGIDVKILIPCNSGKCKASKNPKFFPLSDLNKLVGFGEKQVVCTECGTPVNIYSLVAGMLPEGIEYRRDVTKKTIDKNFGNQLPFPGLQENGSVPGDFLNSEMIRQLLEILKLHAQNPTRVDTNVNVKVDVNFNIQNEIRGIERLIDLMKEDLLIDVPDEAARHQIGQELELVAKAGKELSMLSKEDAKDSAPMKRLENFVKKIEDADTRIGRLFKTLDNGKRYAQELAGYYNRVAELCAMPQVPSIFLKKEK